MNATHPTQLMDPLVADAFKAMDEDAQEFMQERCGIREYLGELERREAEQAALIETIRYLCRRARR